jgi:hypothetical protein
MAVGQGLAGGEVSTWVANKRHDPTQEVKAQLVEPRKAPASAGAGLVGGGHGFK